ncbi:hypothetical protein OSTOST_04950 [Ostertagia ostertagi]
MRDRFTFKKEGAIGVTDFERNVEIGKMKRLEQEKHQEPHPGTDNLTSITDLRGDKEKEQLVAESKKRRRDAMEDYWASKEQQILELKAKRGGKKLGFAETAKENETTPEQQRPGSGEPIQQFGSKEVGSKGEAP